MEIALLGPLRITVRRDGAGIDVPVPGVRLGRLLTRLAADAGRSVSPAELAATVWGVDGPADPVNALQSLVSRLRRVLGGADAVRQTPSGYRLSVSPGDVDLHCFEREVASGRDLATADPPQAWLTLGSALRRWRGEPEYPDAVPSWSHWQLIHDEAQLAWASVGVAVGEIERVLPELKTWVEAHPYREDACRLQMRALAAAGRAAEALTVFEQLRLTLAEQLGSDPDPETSALHVELMRGELTPGRPTVRRSNLPAEVSSFVGREAELARTAALLEHSRLVTVLGPGGVGKTRLAVRVAMEAVARFPDGVWLVELASVTDGRGIVPAVVGSIGIREARVLSRTVTDTAPDPMTRLVEQLDHSDTLLVLDNCEHLIEEVAILVGHLLSRCPGLRVLATSRESLAITGESLMPVAPLALPESDVIPGSGADHAEWSSVPSVRLFLDRARALDPGVVNDGRARDDVVDIVRRLDGLPLAIELAAARLRVLPLSEIRRRLSDRFQLLASGNRAALPRHRTLRAVVEWSWDLLTVQERRMVERLAVFPGGTTVAAAAAVWRTRPGDADTDVAGLLDALVEKSLLSVVPTDPVRYRMLETIREFGLERLGELGDLADARAAHARYVTELVTAVAPTLRTAAQLPGLRMLDAEHDNILAAVRYLAGGADPATAFEIGHAMMWFWVMSGRHHEAIAMLTIVLAGAPQSDHPLRPFVEASLAVNELADEMSRAHGDWTDVRRRMIRLGDRLERTVRSGAGHHEDPTTLVLHAAIRMFSGSPSTASAAVTRALDSTDPWVRGTVRSIRANFLENEGQVEAIRIDADVAHAEFSAVGDRWGLSLVLTARGLVRTFDGDLDGALADYRQALACTTELGTSDDDLLILLRMADVHLRLGEYAEGRRVADLVTVVSSSRPVDAIRSLFSGATRLTATLCVDGPEVAYRDVAELREHVTRNGSGSVIHGHLQAVMLAVTGIVCARSGRPAEALDDLRRAYPAAVATRDRPIIATVGVALATLALSTGRIEDAAEMLGAAAVLRGADDPTDVAVRWIRTEAVAALGSGFAAVYDSGRRMAPTTAIARLAPAVD